MNTGRSGFYQDESGTAWVTLAFAVTQDEFEALKRIREANLDPILSPLLAAQGAVSDMARHGVELFRDGDGKEYQLP